MAKNLIEATITFGVPKQLKEDLQEILQADGRTLSEFLRSCMLERVKEEKKE